jgi:hypothetical protein
MAAKCAQEVTIPHPEMESWLRKARSSPLCLVPKPEYGAPRAGSLEAKIRSGAWVVVKPNIVFLRPHPKLASIRRSSWF